MSVNYGEAYYSVPEYVTEVPAGRVHGYDANPAARSFVGRDSNGQVFILVSSYRDTSQIKDDKTFDSDLEFDPWLLMPVK
jgi:hypothetical protein